MKENIVTFQVAKLAKEKGFDGFCFDAYNTHKMKYSNGWLEYIDDNEIEIPFTSKVLKSEDILAPTQSLLQKWLREEHYTHIHIHLITLSKWQFTVSVYKEIDAHYSNRGVATKEVFKTYEEALEEGLFRALKLLKE